MSSSHEKAADQAVRRARIVAVRQRPDACRRQSFERRDAVIGTDAGAELGANPPGRMTEHPLGPAPESARPLARSEASLLAPARRGDRSNLVRATPSGADIAPAMEIAVRDLDLK
jgi:hypothetical protein